MMVKKKNDEGKGIVERKLQSHGQRTGEAVSGVVRF